MDVNLVEIGLKMALFFNMAWFAILFIQSGWDKIVDFGGNLAWLKEHFGQSPLKGMVKLMLLKLTFFEMTAGVLSLISFYEIFALTPGLITLFALFFSGISLLALFFGQRIAKDYPGAASLVPYFILVLSGVGLFYLNLV